MRDKIVISPIVGSSLKLTRKGRVLLDVDHVELGAPGVTSIIGHNGAGKSLLLKVLTGLVKPDSGTVTWNGETPYRDGYKALGYMKQNAVLLRRSAKANLEFPLLQLGYDRIFASAKADEALDRAGLRHVAETSARVLSGGERQRLSLARMLIVDPEVIILDEPTASLDPQSRLAIEDMILSEKKSGKSITLVTHSLSQARSLSDDIIFLNQAKIFPRKSVTSFFDETRDEVILDFLGT